MRHNNKNGKAGTEYTVADAAAAQTITRSVREARENEIRANKVVPDGASSWPTIWRARVNALFVEALEEAAILV